MGDLGEAREGGGKARKTQWDYSFAQMMETVGSSETLVQFSWLYRTTAQKTAIFMVTAMGISNHMCSLMSNLPYHLHVKVITHKNNFCQQQNNISTSRLTLV
jgi:hypothetical protein